MSPHPPIIVGGMSPPALRRAARCGNGWYGFAIDVEATERCIAQLHAAERPSSLGPLEISVTPAAPVDADALARYEALGVDRLVLLGLAGSASDLIAFVEQAAESLLQ